MRTPLILALDISTTSVKAIGWTSRGKIKAEFRVPLKLHSPHPGWYEQDAEDWYAGAVKAIRGVVREVGSSAIAGVAVTHQRESFVCLDNNLQPIRPAVLWLDERGTDFIHHIDDHIGIKKYHRISGKYPDLSLSFPKFLWIRKNERKNISFPNKIADVFSYISLRFTGNLVTSWASADPLGILDMKKYNWSTELLNYLGITPSQLPDLCPPGTIVGSISGETARATGLLAGIPLVAAGGDGQCAALGVNITEPGVASVNLGTAVVSGIYDPEYYVDKSFRTLCGCVPGTYILEGVIRGGTATISWFIEKFFKKSDKNILSKLERKAGKIPPGSGGLLTVPYWNAANNPYWDSLARGITIGWSEKHDIPSFFRSILEGISFEQRLIFEGMQRAARQKIREIRVLGGGAKNRLWCQILSDVTDCPIMVCSTEEATSLGAAILGIAALDMLSINDISEVAKRLYRKSRQYSPTDNKNLYSRIYKEKYKPLFPKVQPLFHRLSNN